MRKDEGWWGERAEPTLAPDERTLLRAWRRGQSEFHVLALTHSSPARRSLRPTKCWRWRKRWAARTATIQSTCLSVLSRRRRPGHTQSVASLTRRGLGGTQRIAARVQESCPDHPYDATSALAHLWEQYPKGVCYEVATRRPEAWLTAAQSAWARSTGRRGRARQTPRFPAQTTHEQGIGRLQRWITKCCFEICGKVCCTCAHSGGRGDREGSQPIGRCPGSNAPIAASAARSSLFGSFTRRYSDAVLKRRCGSCIHESARPPAIASGDPPRGRCSAVCGHHIKRYCVAEASAGAATGPSAKAQPQGGAAEAVTGTVLASACVRQGGPCASQRGSCRL